MWRVGEGGDGHQPLHTECDSGRSVGEIEGGHSGGLSGAGHFYGAKELSHEEAWKRFSEQHVEGPVYLSIDKDVLDAHSAATNWDQGELTLPELEQLLSVVLHQEQVIGIDICGECPATLDIFKEEQEADLDSRANQELLDFFGGTNRRNEKSRFQIRWKRDFLFRLNE